MANRYQELLNAIPTGTYYPNYGAVFPTRSSPYEFQFPTTTPNRRYGIFVNGVFQGIVDTDGDGVANVSITLPVGRAAIELVDETTRGIFRAFITVRYWATWLAAHADVFDALDEKITSIRAALSLNTVDALFIEDVYGVPLRQSNDIAYILDAYRNVLEELRQAYRLWGARPAGLRQAVAALTGSLPLHIPQRYLADWRVDEQLVDTTLIDTTPLMAVDTFATLNARSRNYVRASFASTDSPVTPPFTSPPVAQPLTVTFDAGWVASAAGDVIIEGLDASGLAATDTFLKPGVASTVSGSLGIYFAEITAVYLTAVAAGGTATIGLATSKFLTLASCFGPMSLFNASAVHAVDYFAATTGFASMQLDDGLIVEVPASGRIRLTGNVGYYAGSGAAIARIDGPRVVTPAGGTINYGTQDRMRFRVDGRSIVEALLPTPPATLAQVATALNNAIAGDTAYGATLAQGNIDILDVSLIVEGDLITLTNARGQAVVFEADTDDIVAVAGRIPFDFSGDEVTTRDSLRDRIQEAGFFISPFDNGSAAVGVASELGGTAGNTTITWSGAGGAILVTSFAFGANANTPYQTRAFVVTDANGDMLQMRAGNGSKGEDSAIELFPGTVDALSFVMGTPSRTRAISAAAAVGDRAITATGTWTPTLPTIVVRDSLVATTASIATGFVQPSFLTALEVWFSPEYTVGDITLAGTDALGAIITETIPWPGKNIVDAGVAGLGPYQTGGRAANSVGTLARRDIGTVDGANATVRVYAAPFPGVAGNAISVQVVAGGANTPVTVTYAAGLLTVALGTGPYVADNVAQNIAREIERQTFFLAAWTGTGLVAIATPSAPALFTTGAGGGTVVHLTQPYGLAGQDFDTRVQPGMVLRLLSGTYVGQTRRIVAVGQGAIAYPPAAYKVFRSVTAAFDSTGVEILLESSFGAAFFNESWEILDGAIGQGSTLFDTVTSLSSDGGGSATGRFQVRIRDGVTDYGIPVRVGRREAATGVNGVITPIPDDETAPFTAATASILDQLIGAKLRIAGSVAAAGANNGLHTVIGADPETLGAASYALTLLHEDWERGRVFQRRPLTTTNWSSYLLQDSSLTWTLYLPGQAGTVVGVVSGGTGLVLAEPGLLNATSTGAIEDLTELPKVQKGEPEGLNGVELDVDLTLAPTINGTESVTVQNRVLPDGWRAYNTETTADRICVWGETEALHLRLEANGGSVFGGGVIVEVPIARAADYRGLPIRVRAWVAQSFNTTPQNFLLDITFDGGATWTNLSTTAVPYSVTDVGVLGYGGAAPTMLQGDATIPVTALGGTHRTPAIGVTGASSGPEWTGLADETLGQGGRLGAEACLVRIRHAATPLGSRLFLERVIVTTTHGYFTEKDTRARHETHANFGELLYAWAPAALTATERTGLGLPDPATGAATVVDPGHIDRIVNAHGYWERVDVSEYDGIGSAAVPVNLIGAYDETAWLAGTLVNMELVPQIPGKSSYVRPLSASVVEGAVLSITAPSNATLPALTAPLQAISRHEGLFPQVADGDDVLYQDGIPVPSTPFPETLATATIGAGANGQVTITAETLGLAGNAHAVTVNAGVGTNRPLGIAYDRLTGALLISLAARDGALRTDENRAAIVAERINLIEGLSAVASGTGVTALSVASGPTSFTGAIASPWRFTSATVLQLASIAAGDTALVAFYRSGPLATTTSDLIYDTASAYTLDYELLMRATTAVLDLGDDYANYLWFVDAVLHRRVEPEIIEETQAIPLNFTTDYRAALPDPANTDTSLATLYQDTGLVRTEIAASDWKFVDLNTVELSSGKFDQDSIYTFEYVAKRANFPRVVSYVLEVRSGVDAVAAAAAVWRAVEPDTPMPTDRFQQARVTLRNVTAPTDVRVRGLGFRGLHLYGADAHAPGVLPLDEET